MSWARMRPRALRQLDRLVPERRGALEDRLQRIARPRPFRTRKHAACFSASSASASRRAQRLRQLADQALEELVHQHLGHARQHALANARQHAADLPIAVDFDQHAVVRSARSVTLAAPLTNPGPPLPSTCSVYDDRRFLVDDRDLAFVRALDCRDTHLHHRVPVIRAGLGQRLDPRDARAQRFGIKQQIPDLLRLAGKGVGAFDLHTRDRTRHTGRTWPSRPTDGRRRAPGASRGSPSSRTRPRTPRRPSRSRATSWRCTAPIRPPSSCRSLPAARRPRVAAIEDALYAKTRARRACWACAARCSSCPTSWRPSSRQRAPAPSRRSSADATSSSLTPPASSRTPTSSAGGPTSNATRWRRSSSGGEATAQELGQDVPGLQTQIRLAEGKSYAGTAERRNMACSCSCRPRANRPRSTARLVDQQPVSLGAYRRLAAWRLARVADALRSGELIGAGCARSDRARSPT